MSHGNPYSIFKRGRIYYTQFKTPTGQWSVAKERVKHPVVKLSDGLLII